jgi:hypothetical protein
MKRLRIPTLSILIATASVVANAALFDAWRHHADLTFGGYTGSETLAAFPVLVSVTNFPGFAYGQMGDGAGGDLRFSDASGDVELNYEVDTWNTSGESHVWVQVPALSGTATSIRAHWGHSTATAPAYTGNGLTWSNGYVSVWHFAETSGTTLNDAVGNYDGTANAGVDFAESGVLGSGARFNGSNGQVALTGMSLVANKSQFTVSGWASLDALGPSSKDDTYDSALFSTAVLGPSYPIILWYNQTQNSNGDRVYSFNVGDTSTTGNRVSTGSGVAQALTWQNIAGVMSGTTRRIYVDGTQRGTATGTQSTTGSATSGNLGYWLGSVNMYFDGAMDEVRLSTVARSADWLRAEWLTAASNTVFATYGETTALIGNRVWDDSLGTPNNGVQDAGETGLVDVAVAMYELVDLGGGAVATNTVATTTTDVDGMYLFSDVPSGEYLLGITPPGGYALSRRNAGTDPEQDSDFIQATTYTAPFALAAGQTLLNVDAGFYYAPTLAVVMSFRAFGRDGTTAVQWEVAEEFDTLYYWLERMENGVWQRINPDAPAWSVAGEVPWGPYLYEVADPGAAAGGTYTWRLVEVENSGRENVYGPYTVTVDGAAADFDAWAAGVAWDGAAAGRDDDPDGDGLTNFEESLAGTDPLSAESVLRITSLRAVPGGLEVRWPSAAGRVYAVEYVRDLGSDWLPVSPDEAATPDENRFVLPGTDRGFLRVVLKAAE